MPGWEGAVAAFLAAPAAAERAGYFALALDEFTDEFYLDHGNKHAQQDRLDAVPTPVGDPRIDAWIGAVGEHLAQRWGLRTPPWTQRKEHYALDQPVFSPDSRALRGVLIVESPPAFRARLLFTRAEPLQRARFPAGVERAAVALEWPKRNAKSAPT